MDAASIQVIWEQVFAFGETQAASIVQLIQQEFVRKYETPGVSELEAGGEEKEAWKGDWDDEKAPNEWYESAAVDPAVDPDRCQDANGGCRGGGVLSTPRNGAQERDSSRTPPPRGKHGKMEEDERL